ncbi:MAG: AAA family ATPase [Chloroflexi bacterium]|nr:AAA family ATPase [Chloroflexota bacterium]
MEFLILGPLEVRHDGRVIPLPGAKQRALLGLLLLHRNRVVSTDQLIDELWGNKQPGTGAAALQMRVSGLRKALEGRGARDGPSDVLLTRPPGYLLRVAADALDADRFEARLDEGHQTLASGELVAAAAAFGEGLSLWRGEPLADLQYEPFAQAEIARLVELRLVATEGRIDADLALGRTDRLVAELEVLVAQHPLRERLRGQLMLALYRSGRQAEALAAYGDARLALRDELGIDPSPALQRLEVAILQQDPGLEPTLLPPRENGPSAIDMTEHRKLVTIVVAEPAQVRGPVAVDPEAWRLVAERQLAEATTVVQRHGGVVERGPGGQVMAVFGVPSVHEDDGLRAIRAALDWRAAASDAPDPDPHPMRVPVSQARIGIETGEVITGNPAAGRPLVTGEPVTRAGRLARAAAPGEILVGGTTRNLVSGIVLEPVRGDGLRGAWRVLELASTPPPAGGRETPLVGRSMELDQLHAAFERAQRVRGAVLCTVIGPAGVGKSRLAREFVSGIEGRARVLTGRCLAYGEGITFWPLNEIVRQLAPDAAIEPLLEGDPEARVVALRIAGAIGWSDTKAGVEETFSAVRRLLEAIARAGPVVVVLEDIHWAEPTLLNLIEHLASWVRDSAIVLICLARPELFDDRPGWGRGRPDAVTIPLGPLGDEESNALLSSQPGSSGLSPLTRRRVRETAEGNPLFLEQIAAMVAERGAPAGDLPVPPTIEGVLAARLDQLGPGERAVLERAAVIGKEFWPRSVGPLLPDPARAALGQHLDSLVRKDLLRPVRSRLVDDDAFQFQHVLIQQAAYRAIPKALRRTLHEEFGNWLEDQAGLRLSEVEELVGYHLEQAALGWRDAEPGSRHGEELARRAGGRLAAAGGRAFRRGDMAASANLLDRAAALHAREDPVRLEILSDLAFALFELGELGRASDVLEEVVGEGTKIGDRRLVARAAAKRSHVEMYRHPEQVDPVRLLGEANRVLSVLRTFRDDAGLARASLLESEVLWTLGTGGLAAKAAERAARYARRADSRREEAWAHGDYGYYAVFGPAPVAVATRRLERWLGEAGGNAVLEANLSGFLAPLEAMARRIPEARKRLAVSRQVTDELGLRWQTGTHDLLGGFIEMLAGDPVAAEAHLQMGIDNFITMGDMWFLSIVGTEQARALLDQGRDEDALSLLGQLDASPGEPPDNLRYRIRRGEILGRILARRGDFDAALRLANEAVRIADRTDYLGFHADALCGLADIHRARGRPADAVAALGGAIELYRRKGNLVRTSETRAALATVARDVTGTPRPTA